MRSSRACKVCASQFQPTMPMQSVCGPKCALERGRYVVLVRQRKNLKARREALKSLSGHHKETQKVFNRYIRLRDASQPCISCGTMTGQRQAGHYRPSGPNPELRYEELNCHVQCGQCNTYLSGNLTKYRAKLVDKIGAELVEWLEGPHEAKHYRVEDLKEIQRHYKAEIKHLEAASK